MSADQKLFTDTQTSNIVEVDELFFHSPLCLFCLDSDGEAGARGWIPGGRHSGPAHQPLTV